MSTPTPSHPAGQALALALEVLRADRQALIDCHSVAGALPEADELAVSALACYGLAIRCLEGLQTCHQRALEALRLADAMLRGAHMDAGVVETKLRAAIAELSADPAAEPVKREPLTDEQVASAFNGWGINRAQESRENSGAWELGHLDEEDIFSPLITVDAGLYHQPRHSEPMARALLAAIQQAKGAGHDR